MAIRDFRGGGTEKEGAPKGPVQRPVEARFVSMEEAELGLGGLARESGGEEGPLVSGFGILGGYGVVYEFVTGTGVR